MANDSNNILVKGLSIVEYISKQSHRVTTQEISLELGIPSATAFRILQTLKALGYVAQNRNKQYMLTYKMLEISSNASMQDNLIDRLLPFMNYFAQQKNCQVGLSVFYEQSIIHLANVGKYIIYNDKYALPGTVLPAYCTAAGKVFLSQMPDDELQEWIRGRNLIPYTSHTIIDPDELLEQIRLTRRQGYGIVISELYDFVACLSIPVVDQEDQVVGALNFSTKPDDFDAVNNEKFIADVKDVIQKTRFKSNLVP